MRLVYLSPVPWESFAQRPHKFVEWFHGRTGEPVLWVDPYPTRFPRWSDRPRLAPSAPADPDTKVPSWLMLLKPGFLPVEPLPGSGLINGYLWRSCISKIGNFVGSRKTLLAIGKPSVFALELLNRLQDCPSLYDAMDDFPAFYTGLSRLALMRREREIVQTVDIILASSSALESRWMNVHKDVRLVRNALDLSAIRSVKPKPKSTEQKVFGYVGTIASWFDWGWVYALAEARPNDEIRLIGPVFDPPTCKLPANINLLPACDHLIALKAMTEFHSGLIPFKKNSLTASVDPIKYYEYRALGLPVISTDFGEMSLRAGERGVFITKTMKDIPTQASFSLQFLDDAEATNSFAIQNSWENRFDAARLIP